MLVNNMINNLGRNLVRMEDYQQKLSTGKKISVPSDDPIVAARALKLRTDVSQIEQHLRNVEDALSWIEITESALANVGDVLQRTRELTVQASTDTLTTGDREKIQSEVEQLKEQLVEIGNFTYAGRYIFSGFQTDTKPLADDGSFNTSVDPSEQIIYEIGISDSININVLGGELFNDGGTATAGSVGSLMKNMSDLITALGTGGNTEISSLLENFDDEIDNLLAIRAGIGARYNRLELTKDRLEEDKLNFTSLMSQNEDVDQAENIMLLKNEENVYKASLSGGSRIIQTSLVDFLS